MGDKQPLTEGTTRNIIKGANKPTGQSNPRPSPPPPPTPKAEKP